MSGTPADAPTHANDPASPAGAGTDARRRLDERYGRRPPRPGRRRLLLGVLATLVAVALAWAVWAAFAVSRSSLSWQDAGADASDPALVRVSFTVRGTAGTAVVCAVRATDADGAVVGWLDVPVTIPASGRASAAAAVPTSQPGTGGGVSSCIRASR